MADEIKPAPPGSRLGLRTAINPDDDNKMTLFTAPDLPTALRHMGLLDPDSAVLMDAARKYKAGDDDTIPSMVMGALLRKHAECRKQLCVVMEEYGRQTGLWHARSMPLSARVKEIVSEDEATHMHAPGIACKTCGGQMRYKKSAVAEKELTPDIITKIPTEVYTPAAEEYRKLCAKEREVRTVISDGRRIEKLLAATHDLLCLEKKMLAAKRACIEVQDKIDSYPDAAAKAEASTPIIYNQLLSCKYHGDLAIERLSIVRQLEKAREAVQKIERHGRVAGHGEVDALEAKLAKIEDEMEALKRTLQEQTGMRGKHVGDMQFTLERRQAEAQNLVDNYDGIITTELEELTSRVDKASGLEARFIMAQEKLLSGVREEGIEITI